jgi:hypothetical protein
MKYIFVCSPLRGKDSWEEELNIQNALGHCREVWDEGRRAGTTYMPLAPHAYFTRFLRDSNPEERAAGLTQGKAWLASCTELWYWLDGREAPSEGMQGEIEFATALGIPVIRRG